MTSSMLTPLCQKHPSLPPHVRGKRGSDCLLRISAKDFPGSSPFIKAGTTARVARGSNAFTLRARMRGPRRLGAK